MKARIHTISPTSYRVTFETPESSFDELMRHLPHVEKSLARAGYLPNGELPRSPEGLPMCPRHGEVMRQREKQGDTWYSHNVTHPHTGEVFYCKGRPGKDSPGWDLGNGNGAQDPPPPPASPPQSSLLAVDGHIHRPCDRSRQSHTSTAKPAPDPPPAAVDDTPTAFWTLATQLMEKGKLTHAQAGEVSKTSGTWAEKAARLALAAA